MSDTTKPCPHCGSSNTRTQRFMQVAATNRQYRQCLDCGAHGPIGDDHESADALWNRRKPETETLREAYEMCTSRDTEWGDVAKFLRLAIEDAVAVPRLLGASDAIVIMRMISILRDALAEFEAVVDPETRVDKFHT